MNKAYLLIGGNVGDRLANLQHALLLIDSQCGSIIATSSIYETAPWGFTEQAPFYNQALCIATPLSVLDLMQQIIAIESSLGRERIVPLGPRTMDIDILYFNDEIIDHELVTIPHPRMEKRNFVLVPLCEIAPEMKHPISQITTLKLLADCEDKSHVNKKNQD